jgi:hypothetical protein
MDSLNLQRGVSANLTIALTNAQGAQVVALNGAEGFELLSQHTSSFTSIVNGESTYREEVSITIMPTETGHYTFTGIILYDGQYHETNALQLVVHEDSDDFLSTPDLFIETYVSYNESYAGEKIILTYILYSRHNTDNFGFTERVSINDAIVQNAPGHQIGGEYIYLDGERYARWEAAQFIIEPIRTGLFTVPSLTFQVNVVSNNNRSFFSTVTPYYLQTNEETILVKPLPAIDRPQDFSGLVGEFTLEGRYSRDELNYGESLALQAVISGSGSLDALKSIIRDIPGAAVYETQNDSTEQVINGRYYAQNTFDVVIVPERTGTLTLPAVSVSFFNPVTSQFERAEIPSAEINVLGEMPRYAEGGFIPSMETVAINQVSYMDKPEGYITVQIKKEWLLAALVGLLIIFAIGFTVIWFVKRGSGQDNEIKILFKRFMASKDVNESYGFFNEIIKHRYGISLKASPRGVVRDALADTVFVQDVMDIMEYMESPEKRAELGGGYLKLKAKGIYNMINLVR